MENKLMLQLLLIQYRLGNQFLKLNLQDSINQ